MWYESQRWIEEEIISNAFKYTIEASIGNHNEEFLTKWYKIWKNCSITLMEINVTFAIKNVMQQILLQQILSKLLSKTTEMKGSPSWRMKFVPGKSVQELPTTKINEET